MKWFKQDCDSWLTNGKVRELKRLSGKNSVEIYGFYSILKEFCSKDVQKNDGIISWTIQDLKISCQLPAQKIKKYLEILCEAELIEEAGNGFYAIPAMLKRVDDYTKRVRTKSEQSPNIDRTLSEKCSPQNQKKKKKKNQEEESESEQPPVTPQRGDVSLDIISLWERLTKGKLPQVKDRELAAKRIREAYKKWGWKYTLNDWEAAIRYIIKTSFYVNDLKPPLKFLLQRTPNGNISQLEYILDKAEPIAAPSIAIPTIPSPPPKFVGYLGTGCKDKAEFDAVWARMNADADALNLRKREEEFRAHLKRHGLSDDMIEERVKINKLKWEKEIHDNRL